MAKRTDDILQDVPDGVRNATLDACIKILRLCKTTEEAERMIAKLKPVPAGHHSSFTKPAA